MKAINLATNAADIVKANPVYEQVNTHIDSKHNVAWCYMNPAPRSCFNTTLLNELSDWCNYLRDYGLEREIHYHVIASAKSGVYNLGGDLELFRNLIEDGDRAGLKAYGKACIDVLYANIRGFHRPITTISLVQGDALGGGFETALSSEIIIAEKGSRMGFPEILFNLIPGMGAFNLLLRKLDAKRAERIILSGKLYSAEELYDMGLVDELAEEGEGEMAVYDYIRRENRARNGFRALREVRDLLSPITYEQLDGVVEIWVDTALRLERRDLRMMERLVSRQCSVAEQAA
ncbi:MAG: crotonase/enoyl-CoA hydratase family protein [Thiohalocapsa sp.]